LVTRPATAGRYRRRSSSISTRLPKPRLTSLHELKRYKNQVCSFVSLNAELQNGIRSEDLTALEMATSRRKRRRRHRQQLIAPRVRAGISSTSHSRPTTRRCNNRYRRTPRRKSQYSGRHLLTRRYRTISARTTLPGCCTSSATCISRCTRPPKLASLRCIQCSSSEAPHR
jgi:hypothetical protein